MYHRIGASSQMFWRVEKSLKKLPWLWGYSFLSKFHLPYCIQWQLESLSTKCSHSSYRNLRNVLVMISCYLFVELGGVQYKFDSPVKPVNTLRKQLFLLFDCFYLLAEWVSKRKLHKTMNSSCRQWTGWIILEVWSFYFLTKTPPSSLSQTQW